MIGPTDPRLGLRSAAFAMLLVAAQLPSPGGRSTAGPRAQDDFSGAWEFTTDDNTYTERLELTISSGRVRGSFTALRRGYFSNRVSTEAELRVEGAAHDGRLDLRMIDPSSGNAVSAQARRRGAYLVLRGGGRETGYARPGTPLVQSAEGSADAEALQRALAGHVYSTSSQAGGRGAFVGGRTKLALCANGDIAYDASDVATTGTAPGGAVDMGSSVSRRGRWSVVLYAGAPTVMARWQGTGTSYSLTAYFDVRPAEDGQSVELSGQQLRAAGGC